MSGKHGACVENDDANEEFTIIDDHFKCESEEEINELFKEQDKGLDEVIDQLDDLKLDLSQKREALDIDKDCFVLDNTSHEISQHPGQLTVASY